MQLFAAIDSAVLLNCLPNKSKHWGPASSLPIHLAGDVPQPAKAI